jgi:hypothetical protein
MAPLSLSIEELNYRRISLRTSFWFALMSAFTLGAEVVRITAMVKDGNHRGDLVLDVAYLLLWSAIGLRWGRGVWESTKPSRSPSERRRCNMNHWR